MRLQHPQAVRDALPPVTQRHAAVGCRPQALEGIAVDPKIGRVNQGNRTSPRGRRLVRARRLPRLRIVRVGFHQRQRRQRPLSQVDRDRRLGSKCNL